MNELAGETLVRAHHGSVAADQRKEIEDRLKMGTLRGLVATSSLELGIDMGAIDLVVQIESPPSVASGMQRVGRASHHVGGTSAAVIFPKYRGDLVACAAITRAMYAGQGGIGPLSAQSAGRPGAAACRHGRDGSPGMRAHSSPWSGRLRLMRLLPAASSIPCSTCFRGRYPSDEFAELRPRITWDRAAQRLTPRQGARSVAVINGGTIPDRGLFTVLPGRRHTRRARGRAG